MAKSRLEESDMPKPYSNRAMSSDEPCNLGHYDHTDSPTYKTPDAVDHRDAPVDDDPIIKYLEALSNLAPCSSARASLHSTSGPVA